MDSGYFSLVFLMSSSHHTQICELVARFIHMFLTGQQFDIAQVILNTMTPYRDSSMHSRALLFAILIIQLLENIGFNFNPSQVAQMSCALIDMSSQAKHYTHVYGLMVPLTHPIIDPQGLLPTLQQHMRPLLMRTRLEPWNRRLQVSSLSFQSLHRTHTTVEVVEDFLIHLLTFHLLQPIFLLVSLWIRC